MKVPLHWLKEYIPTKLTPAQIADALTTIGLEVEEMEDDVLNIALTPNLSHCACIRGIARELAAVTEETLQVPKFSIHEKGEPLSQKYLSITVENPLECPRYACRVITGVQVGPSPSWVKERVEQCGMQSVNNVVDITNLLLLEVGHPLHAFDLDCLEERRIVVRTAKKGEKITTLDGKEHYPTEETLLICDGKKPIAIAGIMGSLESEVGEKTTSVLLEAAYFEPSQVRRASKRMGIHTEASYRFERGVDPNGVLEALDRATAWICEIAGGTALPGVLDIKKRDFPQPIVTCRLSRTNQILGTQLAMSEMETLFRRLQLNVVEVGEDQIALKIPTYRHDIYQEIDLIEEVARLFGYDNIHKRAKAFYRPGNLTSSSEYLFSRKVRCRLISEGLQEFLTCDLISAAQAALISTANFPSRTLIKLLNPCSEAQSVMRPSLLPGMLGLVKYNADRGIDSVSGFEVGRLHFTTKERYIEPSVAAIVMTGQHSQEHWEKGENLIDFFELKGIVENLLESLKISQFSFVKSHYVNFHPGRQAALMVGDLEAGILGEVHPTTLKQAGVERVVYFAELNLENLERCIRSDIKMKPLPQFPASTRDWTVTVGENQEVGQILQAIVQEGGEFLESVVLWDVYRSDKLGSDLKNVTFRFVYRDYQRTISLSTVDNEHLRITKKISQILQRESL